MLIKYVDEDNEAGVNTTEAISEGLTMLLRARYVKLKI